MIESVSVVVQGKDDVVRTLVVALLAGGHVLIEDVPGVGKTTLARALAASLGLGFRRLQFTSDLMPADVIGGSVFDRETGAFTLRKGPIFTQVLLADEINRTTPKTQSALLEAMGEGQVSIEGETYPLEQPFFVVATQNPRDFYGTYPLPESQLDRFLFRVRIGHPPEAIERALLERSGADPVAGVKPVVSQAQLMAAQAAVDGVKVAPALFDYVHALVLATRSHPMLEVGASTRAALAFSRAIKARALVMGRTYAEPDDAKALLVPALSHRVRTRTEGPSSRADAEAILRELAAEIPVPV